MNGKIEFSTGSAGDFGTTGTVGVVLSGGSSQRMGRDKALLEIERCGRRWTLSAWAVERLKGACSHVVLLDGGADHPVPEGAERAADGPGQGPAAGILGAAHRFPDRPLLVLAADLPDVPVSLLSRLAIDEPGFAWTLLRTSGRLHPLCALYRPPLLAALEAAVAEGRNGLWSLYRRTSLPLLTLESEALAAYGDPAQIVTNVNTPADYDAARYAPD